MIKFSSVLLALFLSPSTELTSTVGSGYGNTNPAILLDTTELFLEVSCFSSFMSLFWRILCSLSRCLAFIHGFPFLYIFYCEVAELFVIFDAWFASQTSSLRSAIHSALFCTALLCFVLLMAFLSRLLCLKRCACAALFLRLGVIYTGLFSWFVVFSNMFSLFCLKS